jgi:hypothetical protein
MPGSSVAASSHNSLAGLAEFPSFAAPSPAHLMQQSAGRGVAAGAASGASLVLARSSLGASLQRLDPAVFGSAGMALDMRGAASTTLSSSSAAPPS